MAGIKDWFYAIDVISGWFPVTIWTLVAIGIVVLLSPQATILVLTPELVARYNLPAIPHNTDHANRRAAAYRLRPFYFHPRHPPQKYETAAG